MTKQTGEAVQTAGANQIQVHKITLSNKKVVLVREPEVFDLEEATHIAGTLPGTSDNSAYLMMMVQGELLKRLVVEYDGKKLGLAEKETIKKTLGLKCYMEMIKVIAHLTGQDASGGFNPLSQMEVAFIGKQ